MADFLVKTPNDHSWNLHYQVMSCAYYLSAASGVVAVVASVTVVVLAINVPKWRNYKNFAITNMTISSALYYVLARVVNNNLSKERLIDDYSQVMRINSVLLYMASVVMNVYHCWLFVTCVTLYMDKVMIFKCLTRKCYIYASILAWILPGALKASESFIDFKVAVVFSFSKEMMDFFSRKIGYIKLFDKNFFPLFITGIHTLIFLRVLYCLRIKTNAKFFFINRKIKGVILIFLMGSGTVLIDFILEIFMHKWASASNSDVIISQKMDIVVHTMYGLNAIQMLLTNFLIVLLKSNRRIVLRYLKGKIKEDTHIRRSPVRTKGVRTRRV